MAYDGVRRSLLDAQIALIELHLCAHQREAWTDVSGFGAGRRSDLRKSVWNSQISSHSHVSLLCPQIDRNAKTGPWETE